MSGRPGIVAGLIGRGIQGSASPAMHEAEGRALGLAYVYTLIDLEQLGLGGEALPELLAGAERLGFAGVNVTHPYKQAVVAHLDALAPEAAAIGAVNTVVFEGGRRVGHNTDAHGFTEGFRAALPAASLARVVQMGAGGAGAATAYALLRMGAERLDIVDTDPARSAALVERLAALFAPGRAFARSDAEAALEAADGLVNATPIGMSGHPGAPVAAERLRPDLWVADVVYVPLATELLAAARRLGAPTADGGGMAVHQAARAMALFTGLDPDPARMRRCFEDLPRPAQ